MPNTERGAAGGALRRALGVGFVLAQLFCIARAQLSSDRYLCWAPLHEHARYRISALVGDRVLDDAEIAVRYRLANWFRDAQSGEAWELNAIEHVFDTIRRYESAMPAARAASVRVDYLKNGLPQPAWIWPQHSAR